MEKKIESSASDDSDDDNDLQPMQSLSMSRGITMRKPKTFKPKVTTIKTNEKKSESDSSDNSEGDNDLQPM